MNNFLDIDTLSLEIKEYNRKIETLCDDNYNDFLQEPYTRMPVFEEFFEDFYKFLISNDLFKKIILDRSSKCQLFFKSNEFTEHWKNINQYYKCILKYDGYDYVYTNENIFRLDGPLTSILYKNIKTIKTGDKLLPLMKLENDKNIKAIYKELTNSRNETLYEESIKGLVFGHKVFNSFLVISAVLDSLYKNLDESLYENCKKSISYLSEQIGDYACFYVLKDYILSNTEIKGLNVYFIAIAVKEICDNLSLVLKNESQNYKNQEILLEEFCRSSSLTKREKETLQLSLQDLSNEEIAQKMAITVKSVENYKNRLAPKIKAVLNIEEQVRFKDVVKALKTRIVIN